MTELRAQAGFPRDAGSGASAREFVNAICRDWSLTAVIPDAELVVTELVENAVRHARSSSHVTLHLLPTGLLLTVRDESSSQPRPAAPPSDRPGGRGLLLVERLSAEWGVDIDADGKSVWALLPLPRHNESYAP